MAFKWSLPVLVLTGILISVIAAQAEDGSTNRGSFALGSLFGISVGVGVYGIVVGILFRKTMSKSKEARSFAIYIILFGAYVLLV